LRNCSYNAGIGDQEVQFRRLAKKNGWFVPVSTLLDYLRMQEGWADSITARERTRLELKWAPSQDAGRVNVNGPAGTPCEIHTYKMPLTRIVTLSGAGRHLHQVKDQVAASRFIDEPGIIFTR
jgi:hypothetical protein